MKTILVLLLTLTLSACATGPKRERAKLGVDGESTPPPAEKPENASQSTSSSEDAVPSGEINLGMEGDGGGSLVVEGAMSEAEEDEALSTDEPEEEESEGEKKDDKKEEAKKDDKKKPSGWATGNDDSDYEEEPEQ